MLLYNVYAIMQLYMYVVIFAGIYSLWWPFTPALQVEALMKYTVENHGRLDYLVNNGGNYYMQLYM